MLGFCYGSKRVGIKKTAPPTRYCYILSWYLDNISDNFVRFFNVCSSDVCPFECLKQFDHIDHTQRDGGSEFKKERQEYAHKHIPSIRTARTYTERTYGKNVLLTK